MPDTLTNADRRQKMTTLMLDDETREMLERLASQDETQPGNRSNTVRRLIREEYRRRARAKRIIQIPSA